MLRRWRLWWWRRRRRRRGEEEEESGAVERGKLRGFDFYLETLLNLDILTLLNFWKAQQ